MFLVEDKPRSLVALVWNNPFARELWPHCSNREVKPLIYWTSRTWSLRSGRDTLRIIMPSFP